MAGTEQPDQILLPAEIGGSIKYSIGIVNPFSNGTSNQTDPTIQPIIVHLNQMNGPIHSDQRYFPLVSLDSGTDVSISGRNIDNRTGMNPQGHMVTTIPESSRANNWNMFNFVSSTYYIAYRGFLCNGTTKSEIESLRGNKILKILSTKIIPKLKKLGEKFCNLESQIFRLNSH